MYETWSHIATRYGIVRPQHVWQAAQNGRFATWSYLTSVAVTSALGFERIRPPDEGEVFFRNSLLLVMHWTQLGA